MPRRSGRLVGFSSMQNRLHYEARDEGMRQFDWLLVTHTAKRVEHRGVNFLSAPEMSSPFHIWPWGMLYLLHIGSGLSHTRHTHLACANAKQNEGLALDSACYNTDRPRVLMAVANKCY